MTGRDLIMYILSNNLENEPVFKDGKLLGYMTMDVAAARLNVGVETIKTMINLDLIKGTIQMGETYLIPESYLEEAKQCKK